MSAVISDAMQIIEVIQAVRKIYIRIQGTGKEIDDAFHDVEIMEAELRFLQKTFASKKKMVEEVYGQTMPACQESWFEYGLQNDDKRPCVIVNPQRMPRNDGLYLPNTTQQRPIFQDDRSAWFRTQRCQLAGGRLLEMHLRTSVKGEP